MLKNLTVKQKMMIFILGITLLTYSITLGYIGYTLKLKALIEGKRLTDTFAAQKANDIRSTINEDMAVARDMAMIVKDYTFMRDGKRDSLRENLMISILKGYPKYDATWMSWQLWAIQSGWDKDYGRERVNFYLRNGEIQKSKELANLDRDPTSGVYSHLKTHVDEVEKLSEPYWYEDYDYGSEAGDSILGISPTASIMVDGKFAGVVGSDMTLDDFQSMSKIDFLDRGFAFLLSNQGIIVAHQDPNLYSLSVDTLSFSKSIDLEHVKKDIEKGNQFSFSVYDESFGEEVYISFAPIQIGKSLYPWSAAIIIPISEITKSFDSTFQITMFVGLLGLLLLAYVVWNIASKIAVSLGNSNYVLKELALGKLNTEHRLSIDTNDELGEIANSVNVLLDELSHKADFSRQIGEGKLESYFDMASEDDLLGHSLLKMRDNLKMVINETNDVIQRAGAEGDLSARIKIGNKIGAWKLMSESVNQLLLSVSRPLVSVNKIVHAMADGDLSQRFADESKGDMAKLSFGLNKALDNLNELLLNILNNANIVDVSTAEMSIVSEEMNTNTREIASAISEMSNGAQTQVSKVDESSNLIEGIMKSSNEMGDRADIINAAAKSGVGSSEKGMEMVNKVVFNMGDISEYSTKTQESIRILTERSQEITRVLSVITDIASQTNLLALNAAIEAAQAGDAGRGFAVVAEEIRKLAEDSRSSAREIEELVLGVQTDTEEAAKIIEVMSATVTSGEQASRDASDVFKEITDSSTKTFKYSEEILKAIRLQMKDINDVVTITESVVVIAEQTAAGTEEVASSATELSSGMTGYTEKSQKLADIAVELKEGMSKFILSRKK